MEVSSDDAAFCCHRNPSLESLLTSTAAQDKVLCGIIDFILEIVLLTIHICLDKVSNDWLGLFYVLLMNLGHCLDENWYSVLIHFSLLYSVNRLEGMDSWNTSLCVLWKVLSIAKMIQTPRVYCEYS